MPISIRTDIDYYSVDYAKKFAHVHGLSSMSFGQWNDCTYTANRIKVCYMLIMPSKEEMATLTALTLRYGSFEKAFWEEITKIP